MTEDVASLNEIAIDVINNDVDTTESNNNDPTITTHLYTLSNCKHNFCRSCLYDFLQSKIIQGETAIQCFRPLELKTYKRCSAVIDSNDIVNIISSDKTLLDKYNRFVLLKSNMNMRECNNCSNIQQGDPNQPIIECSNCNVKYCFYHANSHDISESCQDYENRTSNDQKLTLSFIESTTKPCPKCNMAIGKTEGCNHMKCSCCGQAFCWLCGKAIDDTVFPAHFQWWNPYGCSNLQMNEAVEPNLRTRLSARCLTCVELVLFGPLTLLSTILSFFLCSCCVFSWLKFRINEKGNTETFYSLITPLASSCLSGWGMFWIALLFFLPLTLFIFGVGFGFALVLALILYPIYAISRLCKRQYPWPDVVTHLFERTIQYVRNRCNRSTGQSAINDNNNQRTSSLNDRDIGVLADEFMEKLSNSQNEITHNQPFNNIDDITDFSKSMNRSIRYDQPVDLEQGINIDIIPDSNNV